MKTEVLKATEVDLAAAWIKKGQLVAFPTETVYGLGASIFNPEAINRVFYAKGRPQDNPLIAHIADLASVQKIAQDVPNAFFVLAEHFFPGPLTLIVKRHPNVPDIASAGLDTVAIRQPRSSIALGLIRAVGEPLVAPSANLSGRPSSTTAQHVLHDLDGKIAAVIDAGPCPIGIESTVLDLVSFERPTILRPGFVTKQQIEAVLKEEVLIYTQGKMASPGMKYRHYTPDAPVKVFFHQRDLEEYLAGSPKCKRMLLSKGPMNGRSDHYLLLAQNLYATLRQADEERYDEVLLLCDEEVQQDAGLMNRITRMVGSHESCCN